MKTIIHIVILIFLLMLTGCVQETHTKTIKFKLDMRQVKSSADVGVRGTTKPLSWGKTFYLTDTDNDSIYEGIIELNSANFGIEFKFVNQNDQFELQDQNNRTIKFEYKPETMLYEAVFNNPYGKTSLLK